LFGGGSLFRNLAAVGLVDTVEVGLLPVLPGSGIPLLPPPASRLRLTLRNQRIYGKTGIISLEYEIG
jgi:dihydrofolate reductase